MYLKKSGLYISILLLLMIVAFDLYMQSFIVAKNNLGPPKSIFRNAISKENKTISLKPLDYINWVKNPENGLVKTISAHDITYEMQYKPKEYMVFVQERSLTISDTLLQRKVQEFSGLEYFDLKMIAPLDNADLLKYNLQTSENMDSRIAYFAFDLQKDIKLLCKGDTLPDRKSVV